MRTKPSSRSLAFFGAAAITGLAALVPACGDDETTPAGPGPIAVESYRAEYEAARCEFQVRCGLMPDKDTCLRLAGADDELLQLLGDVVYGAVSYDPASARTCVEALRARSCEVLLSVQNQVAAACRGVFTGSSPEGGPCLVAGECAGESVCDQSMCMGGACCAGVCAPAPAKVALGGDCTDAPCVDDAWCDDTDDMVTPTCKARIENGQECTASNACKDGQRCDQSGGAGKCYILSKDGQACNPSLNVACLASNQWCDPAQSKCVKLPGPGEACATGDRCLGFAYCDAGACRMRPIENEACPQDGPQCLGDLRCDMDVCTPQQAALICVLDDIP